MAGLYARPAKKPPQPQFLNGVRKAAVQPELPDGWFLMERLHGPSYYCHEKSGASQFDKPDEEPDSEDDWPWHQPAFGPGTVSAYDGY